MLILLKLVFLPIINSSHLRILIISTQEYFRKRGITASITSETGVFSYGEVVFDARHIGHFRTTLHYSNTFIKSVDIGR